MMDSPVLTLHSPHDYADLVGTGFGPGRWMLIDQPLIDRFAETTGDDAWFHLDVERAQRELPGGRTIAHGLLTLSLIPGLLYELIKFKHVCRALSYGYDRLRFPVPVPEGGRIRLRGRISRAERREAGLFVTLECVVELEGTEKPALVTNMLELIFDA